jgi:ABC-type lipoprotein release transport system permease subunit
VWWRLVVASLRAVVVGLSAGAMLSAAIDSGITQLLPELGSSQWTVRTGAAIGMSIASMAAAMIAARRAASVEPVQALRGE